MKIDTRPDWLTVTGKYKRYGLHEIKEPRYSEEALDAAHKLGDELLNTGFYVLGVWKEVKAPPHYRYAVMCAEAGIMMAFGGTNQGWMVQLHGTWWARRENWDVVVDNIVTYGLHVSRFDYSITVETGGGAASWAAYCGAMAEYRRDERGDTYPVFARPYAPSSLKTVTAGSRRSPIFIRCYDKPYWADDANPALRLEAEYKKDAAKSAFDLWRGGGDAIIHDVLVRWFGKNGTYPEPFEIFNDGKSYESVRSTLPPEPTDREKWFNGVVRKAFKKWAEEDYLAALKWSLECDGWMTDDKEWGD